MDSQPAPPPRGDYFAAEPCTDLADGVVRDPAGTRVLALTEDLLRTLDQTLEAECGPAAERVLKATGRAWGQSYAERLERELGEFFGEPPAAAPVARFQAVLRSALGRVGWGRL